ncbi:hypothetical protein CGZ90_18990, partial [Fictibacillus aquaticus]
MQIMKTAMRRGGMLVLFAAALLTTFHSISGVSAQDITKWLYEQKEENNNRLIEKLSRFIPSSKHEYDEAEKEKLLNNVMKEYNLKAVKVTATGYTAGAESTGKNKNHPAFGIT